MNLARLARRRSTPDANRSRGQALVEFAIVIPIFLLLLFAMLEFGFMLYSQMTVSNSAREAARAATVDPDPSTIQALAQGTVLGTATGLTQSALTTTTTCTPGPCSSSNKQGDLVSVKVDYTYKTFFPLFFGATFHLSQTVQMALW